MAGAGLPRPCPCSQERGGVWEGCLSVIQSHSPLTSRRGYSALLNSEDSVREEGSILHYQHELSCNLPGPGVGRLFLKGLDSKNSSFTVHTVIATIKRIKVTVDNT